MGVFLFFEKPFSDFLKACLTDMKLSRPTIFSRRAEEDRAIIRQLFFAHITRRPNHAFYCRSLCPIYPQNTGVLGS